MTKFKTPSVITPHLKNIYDAMKQNGKDQKGMRVCSEIKNKMQVEIDQFGKPFFKPDELLDASQIKCLITCIERKNWTIECDICQKKFCSKKNLASSHFLWINVFLYFLHSFYNIKTPFVT